MDQPVYLQTKKLKLKRLRKNGPKITKPATPIISQVTTETNVINVTKPNSDDRRIILVKKNRKPSKKLKYEGNKRSSDILVTLNTKSIKGPRPSNDEPMLIPGDEKGTLTQEPIVVVPDSRKHTCFREIRSWDDISRGFFSDIADNFITVAQLLVFCSKNFTLCVVCLDGCTLCAFFNDIMICF